MVFVDFIKFLLQPKSKFKRTFGINNYLIDALQFSVLLSIIYIGLGIIVVKHLGVKSNIHIDYSNYKEILIIIIVAPILEELTCRLLLIYKKVYALITFPLLVYFLLSLFLSFKEFFYIKPIVTIIFIPITYFFLKVKNNEKRIEKLWRDHYGIVFYFFAIVFSIGHFDNFIIPFNKFWVLPIMIFPIFFGGLVLGYIRVKYNLLAAIILHSFNNSIPLIIMLIKHS